MRSLYSCDRDPPGQTDRNPDADERDVIPFAFSRLLAPTLRKERAKARQPVDVLRPTIGGSPRKEGGVYHILQA
jgi:hypothetical protein